MVIIAATYYCTSPRASKFCFLKLPIVFGYAVSFTAISKKQNRKGSPTSLIYPFGRELTSFSIKQFFRFNKEHQTLMRSRLRRFLMLSATRFDYKKFDSPFGLPQDDSKDGYGFKYILLEEYILNEHKRHENQ